MVRLSVRVLASRTICPKKAHDAYCFRRVINYTRAQGEITSEIIRPDIALSPGPEKGQNSLHRG